MEVENSENFGPPSNRSQHSRSSINASVTYNQRVESFEDFPPSQNVNPIQLAKHGFMYDKFSPNSQSVTCVGCNKTVDRWNAGDLASDAQFHGEGCRFVRHGSAQSGGALSFVNETRNRASVQSNEEITKPYETASSSGLQPPHELNLPGAHSYLPYEKKMNTQPIRQASSMPPTPTHRYQLTRIERGGSTTSVHRLSSLTSQEPNSPVHGPSSPFPSFHSIQSAQLNSGNFSNPGAALQDQESFQESTSGPSTLRGAGENHSLHLSRLENPDTLEEIIANFDMRVAENRLYTFERFWPIDIVFRNIRLLVMCGFYCLGQGDAVECFCCHVIAANWSRNDNPRQRHMELSPLCRFIKGEDCGDTPLSVEVRRSSRSSTRSSPAHSMLSTMHSYQPSSPAQSPGHSPFPRSPQRSLFTRSPQHSLLQRNPHHSPSQGSSHRSPYHSLGQISQPSLDVAAAARGVSPVPELYGSATQPTSPVSVPYRSVPPALHVASPVDPYRSMPPAFPVAPAQAPYRSMPSALPAPEPFRNPSQALVERSNLMLEFPCSNPANPAMREENARLQTFTNSQFRRNTQMRASNETMAQAGLYYLGDHDRTKCWFCDGGLKSFQAGDDPWVEHAKFFPQCEYLLQQRGPAWVTSISIQNPNLQRPILPSRDRRILPNVVSSPTPLAPQPPRIEDPVEIHRIRTQMLEEGMTSEPAQAARNMGFSEQRIREVQRQNINDNGCCYQSSESLIDALLLNGAPGATGGSVGGGRNVINMDGGNIRINGSYIGPSVINGQVHLPQDGGQYTTYTTSNPGQIIIDGQPMDQFMANAFNHPFFRGEMDHLMETQPAPTPRSHVVINNIGRRAAPRRTIVVPPIPAPAPPVRIPTPSTTSSTSNAPSSSSTTATTSVSAQGAEAASGTPAERLEELERERRCKICLTENAEILFQPCGHICACNGCATRVTSCPVCRMRIERYVRTYRA